MANEVDLYNPPSRPRTASNGFDPTGLFDSGAVPALSDAAEAIYEYVESKANEVGTSIPKNRGLPPAASPENMLSVEEKAIIILGRSLGVVWDEIKDRIAMLRLERGEDPPSRSKFYTLTKRLVKANKEVVAAIQADLLEATEAFSPLVNGTQRFLWRAKLVEMYRQKFIEVSLGDYNPADGPQLTQLRLIDAAMRQHLAFFDSVGALSDVSKMLASPADRVREHSQVAAEAQLRERKEKGEITEEEYVNQLRLLRFGQES